MTQTDADRRDPETYAIIGAAMEVHGQLGCGFLEPVYQEAMAIELVVRGICFIREAPFPIFYRGKQLSTGYRADFLCLQAVIAACPQPIFLLGRLS